LPLKNQKPIFFKQKFCDLLESIEENIMKSFKMAAKSYMADFCIFMSGWVAETEKLGILAGLW
jgi:hypothetical protein